MASAHILQYLKIGILLLAKIVNGGLLYRRRQIYRVGYKIYISYLIKVLHFSFGVCISQKTIRPLSQLHQNYQQSI